MSSTNISGKNGKVLWGAAQIASVTDWSLDVEVDIDQFATSDSAGWKLAVDGVQSASGSVTWKRDNSALAAFSGSGAGNVFPSQGGSSTATVTLNLYEDSTHFWAVPSKLKNQKIKVDPNTGNAVGGSFDFVSTGQVSPPTYP